MTIFHTHTHGEHEHSHAHAHHAIDSNHSAKNHRGLQAAMILTFIFMGVEVVVGWFSGSLALVSDAGHMLTDSFSLGLAVLAARLAQRPASARFSYGFVRVEILTALLNAALMLAVIVGIVVEAIARLQHPLPVAGGSVMLVAALGLGVNLLAAWWLAGDSHSLNQRAALLHVLGDLLGSVAALIAGAVVWWTGWTPIDPILSLLVAILLLNSTVRLFKQAVSILLESVPTHLDTEHIGRHLLALDGVQAVHSLHVWSLSSEKIALSAHLELQPEALNQWLHLLEQARIMLKREFHIEHITLQPEVSGWLQQPYISKITLHLVNSNEKKSPHNHHHAH